MITKKDISRINFEKSNGLVPAVIQHYQSLEVLMLGYMNEESLDLTIKEKKVCFFSRSKGRLWVKGESSKNFLIVKNIHLDCDLDTILIMVDPVGPTCHTGARTCFGETDTGLFISRLDTVIQQRKKSDDEKSYTSKLLKKGIKKIAQKVGEESVELILEAERGSDERLISETADMMYHLLVLLRARNLSIFDIDNELKTRHNLDQS